MSTHNRTAKALLLVLPAGAVGASMLLALSSAHAVTTDNPSTGSTAEHPAVATRLKEIRAAVAELNAQGEGSAKFGPADSGTLIPTWWGNGGWGRWHGGWGNGGWRFGWHNGGWGNGGWPNWHNGGWGNGGWPNGWHNYWHNG